MHKDKTTRQTESEFNSDNLVQNKQRQRREEKRREEKRRESLSERSKYFSADMHFGTKT